MTYTFSYDGAERPRWDKTLTAQSGETFTVPMVFENEEDRLTLSVVQAYQHIGNLVAYMKDKTSNIAPIGLDDEIPLDGWHFLGGWGEVEWAKEEVFKWWNWAYYNDAFGASESA